MRSERGVALITALLILSFLTILGAGMLTSTTVDTRISANYRTNMQLLFLTEAGLEAGRESLRNLVEAKIDADVSTATAATTNSSVSPAGISFCAWRSRN